MSQDSNEQKQNDLVNQDSNKQQQNNNTQKFPIIEKYDFESILKAMSYIFQSIKNEIMKQIAILLKRVTDMVKISSVLVGSAVQQIGKPFKNLQETAGKGFETISGVGNNGTNGMKNNNDKSASIIRTPMKALSDLGGALPLVGEQFSKFEAKTLMTDNKLKANKSTDKTATKPKSKKIADRQSDNIEDVECVETLEREPTPKKNPAKAQQKPVNRKTPVPKRKPDPSTEEEDTVEDDGK